MDVFDVFKWLLKTLKVFFSKKKNQKKPKKNFESLKNY